MNVNLLSIFGKIMFLFLWLKFICVPFPVLQSSPPYFQWIDTNKTTETVYLDIRWLIQNSVNVQMKSISVYWRWMYDESDMYDIVSEKIQNYIVKQNQRRIFLHIHFSKSCKKMMKTAFGLGIFHTFLRADEIEKAKENTKKKREEMDANKKELFQLSKQFLISSTTYLVSGDYYTPLSYSYQWMEQLLPYLFTQNNNNNNNNNNNANNHNHNYPIVNNPFSGNQPPYIPLQNTHLDEYIYYNDLCESVFYNGLGWKDEKIIWRGNKYQLSHFIQMLELLKENIQFILSGHGHQPTSTSTNIQGWWSVFQKCEYFILIVKEIINELEYEWSKLLYPYLLYSNTKKAATDISPLFYFYMNKRLVSHFQLLNHTTERFPIQKEYIQQIKSIQQDYFEMKREVYLETEKENMFWIESENNRTKENTWRMEKRLHAISSRLITPFTSVFTICIHCSTLLVIHIYEKGKTIFYSIWEGWFYYVFTKLLLAFGIALCVRSISIYWFVNDKNKE